MKRFALAVLLTAAGPAAAAGDVKAALDAIVGSKAGEGADNAALAAAWKTVVAAGEPALVPTLAAFAKADPTRSANWLRTAADAICEPLDAAKKLPLDALEAFVKDAKNPPVGRRIAYEWLVRGDAKAPGRLLPGMIDDPSVEIRRDAIAAALPAAKTAAELTKLFDASRDAGQAKAIAEKLTALGAKADIAAHFGCVTKWQLAGPFDAPKSEGYTLAYDPETKVDPAANYRGKDGKEVKWVPFASEDPFGVVDLNKAVGKFKDAVAFAYAVVESPKEMPVEVRLGSNTAVKVYLNGKEVFGLEEYHHGDRFDQYVGRGTLEAGTNAILVKMAQNNQTEPWAQDWKFQLRLCDETGGALPVKVVESKK